MNNLAKQKVQAIVLICLAFIGLGLIVKGIATFIQDVKHIDNVMGYSRDFEKEIQELEFKNTRLTDSIVFYSNSIKDLNRTVAQHEIVIENLKIRKNEKINHIDTMSSNDLYLFFTEQ
jgi:hypothetical protein